MTWKSYPLLHTNSKGSSIKILLCFESYMTTPPLINCHLTSGSTHIMTRRAPRFSLTIITMSLPSKLRELLKTCIQITKNMVSYNQIFRWSRRFGFKPHLKTLFYIYKYLFKHLKSQFKHVPKLL